MPLMIRCCRLYLKGEQGAVCAVRKDEVLHLFIRRVAPSLHQCDLFRHRHLAKAALRVCQS